MKKSALGKRAFLNRLIVTGCSVERVLEGFTGAKLWQLGGLDLDGLTRPRVATCSRGPLGDREGSESDQGDGSTLFEGGADSANQGIQRPAGRCFRDISLLGDVFDEISLIHFRVLKREIEKASRAKKCLSRVDALDALKHNRSSNG